MHVPPESLVLSLDWIVLCARVDVLFQVTFVLLLASRQLCVSVATMRITVLLAPQLPLQSILAFTQPIILCKCVHLDDGVTLVCP